jgi:hypothetical protein
LPHTKRAGSLLLRVGRAAETCATFQNHEDAAKSKTARMTSLPDVRAKTDVHLSASRGIPAEGDAEPVLPEGKKAPDFRVHFDWLTSIGEAWLAQLPGPAP